MKLIYILFIAVISFFQLEEVPVSYQGRFRPMEINEEALTLPGRYDKGEWLPLKIAGEGEKNVTAYSDFHFNAIRSAYLKKDKKKLAEALNSAYETIAGTPYRKAAGRRLYFPSTTRLKAEALYKKARLPLFVLALYLAALLFRSVPLFIGAFLFHTLTLALRSYILGRPPVSNMYETTLFVPWVASLSGLGLFFIFRSKTALAAASIAALLLLALPLFLRMPDTLGTVQPVLDSGLWLTIHVLAVVGSYGLFIFAGLLGHLYLLLTLRKENGAAAMKTIAPLILQSLYIGTALLIGGTILGGVWAAQSWGRFWDWDPKESWAFISSCLYLLWIHAYRFGYIKERGLAYGSVVGLLAITFTWYGVNYILGTGLHSYGFGSGGEGLYTLYIGGELVFLAFISAFSYYLSFRSQKS